MTSSVVLKCGEVVRLYFLSLEWREKREEKKKFRSNTVEARTPLTFLPRRLRWQGRDDSYLFGAGGPRDRHLLHQLQSVLGTCDRGDDAKCDEATFLEK